MPLQKRNALSKTKIKGKNGKNRPTPSTVADFLGHLFHRPTNHEEKLKKPGKNKTWSPSTGPRKKGQTWSKITLLKQKEKPFPFRPNIKSYTKTKKKQKTPVTQKEKKQENPPLGKPAIFYSWLNSQLHGRTLWRTAFWRTVHACFVQAGDLKAMISYRFLSVSIDFYRFLWISIDFYRFRLVSLLLSSIGFTFCWFLLFSRYFMLFLLSSLETELWK